MVDDKDFEYLSQFNWHAEKTSSTFYASRYFFNKESNRKSRKRMHREILGTIDPRIVSDHIDRNGLNNQRSNLRSCTQAENLMNRRHRKLNSIGYKGVSVFKNRNHGMWKNYKGLIFRARIGINKKEIGLGYFKTSEEAAKAYDLKAREIYGKFAYLNFP